MIFIDASALIAIIAGENDADILADRIESDRVRLISAMSAWETVSGLCRIHAFSITAAQDILKRYAATGGFDYVQIGEREYGLTTQAYADYGSGRHPAALNMGNCFAYACAKSNRAALLFKGDHFTKTDITAAFYHSALFGPPEGPNFLSGTRLAPTLPEGRGPQRRSNPCAAAAMRRGATRSPKGEHGERG